MQLMSQVQGAAARTVRRWPADACRRLASRAVADLVVGHEEALEARMEARMEAAVVTAAQMAV